MTKVSAILLPTRPQPDTIVAIFLLKKFGSKKMPGIENARIEIRPSLEEGETFESLLALGAVALDVGGGPLDHHGSDFCTTELVARYLGIYNDPSLGQLLAYANRDDKEGKGTISRDPIDRAFGLSGLVAALNKSNPKNPEYVINAALPLIEAHWRSQQEHHVELPQEVKRKTAEGMYEEFRVMHGNKELLVSCIVSDKPSMPAYLRSLNGPRADVVVQKSETTNHICILTKQDKKVNLSFVAALIRLREGENLGMDLGNDPQYLGQTGRIAEIQHWYYDPATNSLLNGGPLQSGVLESSIDWTEFKNIVRAGLASEETSAPSSSYYLSINIPGDVAERIVEKLEAPRDVKVHGSKNLHITLQHLGQKTPTEAETIAAQVREALEGQPSFEMTLHDGQLRAGSPEGYSDTTAWYLEVDVDTVAVLQHMRSTILSALGLPTSEKLFHVTLAAKRDRRPVPQNAVRFGEVAEMTFPITEMVLMESAQEEGKRIYRAHSTFTLSS